MDCGERSQSFDVVHLHIVVGVPYTPGAVQPSTKKEKNDVQIFLSQVG